MTDSENNLRIINGLPKEICYKTFFYSITIDYCNGWRIFYSTMFRHGVVFQTEGKHETIEQAALEMYEILIENNLYK